MFYYALNFVLFFSKNKSSTIVNFDRISEYVYMCLHNMTILLSRLIFRN